MNNASSKCLIKEMKNLISYKKNLVTDFRINKEYFLSEDILKKRSKMITNVFLIITLIVTYVMSLFDKDLNTYLSLFITSLFGLLVIRMGFGILNFFLMLLRSFTIFKAIVSILLYWSSVILYILYSMKNNNLIPALIVMGYIVIFLIIFQIYRYQNILIPVFKNPEEFKFSYIEHIKINKIFINKLNRKENTKLAFGLRKSNESEKHEFDDKINELKLIEIVDKRIRTYLKLHSKENWIKIDVDGKYFSDNFCILKSEYKINGYLNETNENSVIYLMKNKENLSVYCFYEFPLNNLLKMELIDNINNRVELLSKDLEDNIKKESEYYNHSNVLLIVGVILDEISYNRYNSLLAKLKEKDVNGILTKKKERVKQKI